MTCVFVKVEVFMFKRETWIEVMKINFLFKEISFSSDFMVQIIEKIFLCAGIKPRGFRWPTSLAAATGAGRGCTGKTSACTGELHVDSSGLLLMIKKAICCGTVVAEGRRHFAARRAGTG